MLPRPGTIFPLFFFRFVSVPFADVPSLFKFFAADVQASVEFFAADVPAAFTFFAGYVQASSSLLVTSQLRSLSFAGDVPASLMFLLLTF